MKQGQTLDLELRGNQGNACDIAAGVCPTLGDADADWVCTIGAATIGIVLVAARVA